VIVVAVKYVVNKLLLGLVLRLLHVIMVVVVVCYWDPDVFPWILVPRHFPRTFTPGTYSPHTPTLALLV